jgi:hypothetical protein
MRTTWPFGAFMNIIVARTILVCTLAGSIPLSLGIILDSSWLRWTGTATVGIACLISFIWMMQMLWVLIRVPKADTGAARIALEEEISEPDSAANRRRPFSSGTNRTSHEAPSLRKED